MAAVSNLDPALDVVVCRDASPAAPVQILTPREVPLGGLRAMTVRRSLPQRDRSLIGAWCFVDHYGPDRVADTGGMAVAPHPHTGLQTVSWLFAGEIEHRDSTGVHAMVRRGELNLMTAGAGIAHSEVSTDSVEVLHGAQLWVALPASARDTSPGFQHYAPATVAVAGGSVAVFLGALAGQTSPVTTFTPLLGAQLLVDPGATVALELDPTFEHGVLVDQGELVVDDTAVAVGELGYLPRGQQALRLHNPGDEPTRLLLLGGPPFGEQILMWWNFVGRTNAEIAEYREQWQAELAGTAEHRRFGAVPGNDGPPIPAPRLPGVPLRPRG